ncbi:sensor histidine kinase [Phaeacidiphilus oryzae]|uniref:sensor histidine kinase n=1 Tax=Phaeacidiphilus oryzae TaxID=348818 RepID=UPI0009FBE788|nr:HAMP domain-containing sensor histidine kinase [Phaeacidiphilus oryzae]
MRHETPSGEPARAPAEPSPEQQSPPTVREWGSIPEGDPERTTIVLPFRPTIRIRLTLLYGGMFLAAGIVLLLLIYFLANDAITEATRTPYTFDNSVTVQMNGQTLTGHQFQELMNGWQSDLRHQALVDLLRRSISALVALTLIAFAFGYAMAGRVLRPLGRITRTAREVAGSDLHRRIELEGPDDEFKELADTFDDMLDRLDRSFETQRTFVANASHELRTPLAINRTLLEVQLSDPQASADLQQLGKTLLATNERSEQLVEGLLLLARSENELTDRRPVDLAEVGAQALEQVRPEAESRGVELRSELRPAVVAGNGVLLERIALNLTQNAVRYNLPEDGWAEVSISESGGYGVLVVTNSGPQVPGYELEHIFEPFRRLKGKNRTGSDKGVGLGLSIVRSVVRAHGGAIEVTARPEGGLGVRVRIPKAPPKAEASRND